MKEISKAIAEMRQHSISPSWEQIEQLFAIYTAEYVPTPEMPEEELEDEKA